MRVSLFASKTRSVPAAEVQKGDSPLSGPGVAPALSSPSTRLDAAGGPSGLLRSPSNSQELGNVSDQSPEAPGAAPKLLTPKPCMSQMTDDGVLNEGDQTSGSDAAQAQEKPEQKPHKAIRMIQRLYINKHSLVSSFLSKLEAGFSQACNAECTVSASILDPKIQQLNSAVCELDRNFDELKRDFPAHEEHLNQLKEFSYRLITSEDDSIDAEAAIATLSRLTVNLQRSGMFTVHSNYNALTAHIDATAQNLGMDAPVVSIDWKGLKGLKNSKPSSTTPNNIVAIFFQISRAREDFKPLANIHQSLQSSS